MQHVQTLLDLLPALVLVGTQEMDPFVKISMNVFLHHPAIRTELAQIPMVHTRVDVIQGIQETEHIAMI